MAIRVERNEQGNCVNFHGSSNPTYWNACLTAYVDDNVTDAINIVNDIITAQTGVTEYEFFQIPYTEFTRADNSDFATAQEAADYISQAARVIGVSPESNGNDLNGVTVCFKLDDTSTSIILDNGYSFGVNTIKAVAEGGVIEIHSISGDRTLFSNLDAGNVCINDVAVSGGLNDVVNALNELFTVGAFEAVVIADPYSTMIADVSGETAGYTLEGSTAVDPTGDDIFTNSSSGNYAGLKSTATINQAGEYFTFDIRGEGQIGFGLIHTQESYDNGYYSGNSNYADPSTFAVSNSAHYGFQFSHWFHPTPNGSWTNYGANTNYSIRSGWNNWESQDEWLAGDPVKIKVGIDENGFIAISSLQDDNTTWVVHARTTYPVSQGSEFHLGVKTANSSARVFSAPKVHALAVDAEPITVGDNSITVLNGATGNLNDGVIVTSASGSNDGFLSAETLDALGEYFEIELNENEDHLIGLVYEDDYSVATIESDTANWTAGKYMFLGGKINTNEQFTSTTYKKGSGASIGSTVLQRPLNCTHFRVGFDTQGRASLWCSTDGVNFTQSIRHNSAAPTGNYRLIWIGNSSGASFESLSKGELSTAPVMYFRYIESPDGVFQYPLFATEEEANYYDEQNGGAGASHTHVYADDPTNTTWYMPETNAVHNGTSAPLFDLTLGQSAAYTEITSLTNADQVPPAFTDTSITVDELSTINYQLSPVDVGYTTTVGNAYGWTVVNGTTLMGTAPEVTGDNVANPSDVTTVTVYRTNSYGTSQGTLTVNITNLTAPVVTPITGVTDEGGTALVDSDTLDDGSVVSIDNVINVGNRFTFDKEWVDNYVLPKITSGTGAKAIFIGFPKSTANWSSVGADDFLLGYQFYSDDTARTQNNWRLRVLVNGVIQYNVGVGGQTSGLYDYALVNDGTEIKLGSLVASQGLDISTYVYNFSGTDATWKYTGGLTGISSANQDIVIATAGTDMDLDLQYFNEYTEPTAPTSLTNWTKALDFSGSNEYAMGVSNSYYANPINMGGLGVQVSPNSDLSKTATTTVARPWATAIVFKSDRVNSNQHIWNAGEGASTNQDNIYLRHASNGGLYFGWGREGTGYNEAFLGVYVNNQSWYGVYIAHKGQRYAAAQATPTNLASAFDIKIMSNNGDNFTNISTYATATGAWTKSGQRMDRGFTSKLTIGGRFNNRSFFGKVASMVVTALPLNTVMPDDTEVKMMITDPKQWLQDYRVGQQVRNVHSYTNTSWGGSGVLASGYGNTQIWLMGDGTSDSYANGMRNEVNPNDQNYTKLQLNSMVSNDIQTVNINGLT